MSTSNNMETGRATAKVACENLWGIVLGLWKRGDRRLRIVFRAAQLVIGGDFCEGGIKNLFNDSVGLGRPHIVIVFIHHCKLQALAFSVRAPLPVDGPELSRLRKLERVSTCSWQGVLRGLLRGLSDAVLLLVESTMLWCMAKWLAYIWAYDSKKHNMRSGRAMHDRNYNMWCLSAGSFFSANQRKPAQPAFLGDIAHGMDLNLAKASQSNKT